MLSSNEPISCDDGRVQCPICLNKFADIDLFVRHDNKKHKQSQGPYQPFLCFDNRIQCRICLNKFQDMKVYTNHYNRKHVTYLNSNNTSGEFKCSECSKVFKDANYTHSRASAEYSRDQHQRACISNNQELLSRPIPTEQGEEFICNKCSRVYRETDYPDPFNNAEKSRDQHQNSCTGERKQTPRRRRGQSSPKPSQPASQRVIVRAVRRRVPMPTVQSEPQPSPRQPQPDTRRVILRAVRRHVGVPPVQSDIPAQPNHFSYQPRGAAAQRTPASSHNRRRSNKRFRPKRNFQGSTRRGEPPPSESTLSFRVPPPPYKLPESVVDLLFQGSNLDLPAANQHFRFELSQLLSHFVTPVNRTGEIKRLEERESMDDEEYARQCISLLQHQDAKTHKSFLKQLLWTEEVQMKGDIRQYDLDNYVIRKDGRRLHIIRVPGLAEKRPSVLRGDRIVAKPTDPSTKSRAIEEGFCHFTNLEDIRVSFHPNFTADIAYDVQFTFSRTCLRHMHQAAENSCAYEALHPPPGSATGSAGSLERDRPNLGSSNLNTEQQNAVHRVLQVLHTSHSPPLVLFGPPGTGKTTTVIQMVMHVLLSKPYSDPSHTNMSGLPPKTRVLLTAPSNHAADLLCQKLAETWDRFGEIEDLGPAREGIFRLNAFRRHQRSVPDDVKEFSFYDWKSKGYTTPSLAELGRYRVVISTVMSSSNLASLGQQPGAFSAIIVDEAGQALYPEALIPLCLAGERTVKVFAGDPKQLGPIIRSRLAMRFGLSQSLLDQLCQGSEHKSEGTENIQHLVQSYRAHPDILSLYSKVFYNDELVHRAPRDVTEQLLDWPDLPNPTCPLLFRHVRGREEREEDSPSWYNQKELNMILTTLRSLFRSAGYKRTWDNSDIGIITPYNKQKSKIQQMFYNKPEFDKITVGTTEVFQGKEKKIIIISTVRSREEFLQLDAKFNIGFLDNPKRLNVAISRPRSLLVVIGNAEILARDVHWRKVIRQFIEHDAFQPRGQIPEVLRTDLLSPEQRIQLTQMNRQQLRDWLLIYAQEKEINPDELMRRYGNPSQNLRALRETVRRCMMKASKEERDEKESEHEKAPEEEESLSQESYVLVNQDENANITNVDAEWRTEL